MNRRDFLKTIGLGAAAMVLPGCAAALGKPPATGRKLNFVLILVDDLGWMDVGCYGSSFYETPNIDRLASEGMRFTDGYAACAVCSPTRAAVMTGRYPARVGLTDWIHCMDFKGSRTDAKQKGPTEYVGGKNNKLLCPPNPFWMELDEVTIAEVLKAAGYTCCHVGKWHLGPDAWYPDEQGFDFNIGGCDYGQPPSYFDPYHKNEQRPNIPTLKGRRKGEYLTDRESDEAVNFIRRHKDKPFFLYMAHYAVHTPIEAKAERIAKYKARKQSGQNNPTYAAMIESMDDAVGQIMSTLDELNLSDNTVVIFTSDNGGLSQVTNNAPLRAGKGYPYEGGIRVAVIIRWPGVIRAGTVSDEPVTSVDYFPTICELANVRLPHGRTIDGLSLAEYLKSNGTKKPGREAVFWHFPHYRDYGVKIVPYSIIRADNWKLIKRYEGREFELFNLKDDLSEQCDLSDEMPEKVKELNAKLTVWLKATGTKLPKLNPEYAAVAGK